MIENKKLVDAAFVGNLDLGQSLVDPLHGSRGLCPLENCSIKYRTLYIHETNSQSLRFAIANGHMDVVQYLVEEGAVHVMNLDLESKAHISRFVGLNMAMQHAVKFRRLDIVAYLLHIISCLRGGANLDE